MRAVWRTRLLPAVCLGALAALVTYLIMVNEGRAAHDFTWPWAGARDLMAGLNPYQHAFSEAHPFRSPLYYPLPAVLLAVPLAPLPAPLAAAVFMGLSVTLLAYAILGTAQGYLWPVLLSAPLWVALRVGQWAPLLLAASLLPSAWHWLLICKPNIGLALLAHQPRRRSLWMMLGVAVASLLVMPEWPLWWLSSSRLGMGSHTPALLTFPGPLLLLAALRWRSPEGRLLLALALIPQHPYWYDSLPVWLVSRTWKETLLLSVSSQVGFWLSGWRHPVIGDSVAPAVIWPWMICFVYLPALALVLWRYRSCPCHLAPPASSM